MTLLENLQNDIRFFLTGDSATAPLLKRVLLFLEDGEFTQADAYCEKVLDIDPENPLAYLCKLMASRRIQSLQDLTNAQYTIDGDSSYKKCVRFAPEAMKQHLHTLNMLIYTNCIAASRNRARVHMSHGELKETAQQYHTAMKLWEDSKDTLPNAKAIYDDLANEVADFNWKLMLHNRQCPDDRQLVARAIPIENDRWYQSACKWADEAKRTYFASVAKETLFNAHLKCMEAIRSGQTKLATVWSTHYQAAAPNDDPLSAIHEALVPTDGYTRFAPNAVKAMLKLISLYNDTYPQGVDGIKALLQDYYQNIFQSLLDFTGKEQTVDVSATTEDYARQIAQREAAASGNAEPAPVTEEATVTETADTDPAQAMNAAREITCQMAEAIADELSPYGPVSTYLVAAKALTIRYSKKDGIITNAELFRFVCGYYNDAIANAPAEQADAIREKFNDFLIETVRLPSASAEVAAEASACMDSSNLPYQLYLSRLTNDYSIDKEQLIPKQLTEGLARWRQLLESAQPKKDHYWIIDQQTDILAAFSAAEKAAETCRQYPSALQTDLDCSYKTVMECAGDIRQDELSSGWSQKMAALQGHCNEWADSLAQELAQVKEINEAKLLVAKKRIKVTEALQLTRGIVSVLAMLLTALAFIAVSIPAIGFGWYCAKSPAQNAAYTPLLFYCINIGLPALAGILCLINSWAARHYDNGRFRRTIWLFAVCSALSYLSMCAVSNRLLLDPHFTVMIENATKVSIFGGILVLCAVCRILLEGSFSKLSQRTRSNATKITCKIGSAAAWILLLAQMFVCFFVAGLFIYTLVIG